jgi:hypothetical protein
MSWYKKASIEELVESLQKEIRELIDSVDLSDAAKAVLKPSSDKIPKAHVGKIGDFDIFVVNGDLVKTRLEMDFVEGANDQAYASETNPDNKDVIPGNEIWLSSEIRSEFIPYILYHELIEANIMKSTGADYSSAHKAANDYEKIARKNKIFG